MHEGMAVKGAVRTLGNEYRAATDAVLSRTLRAK
jgi:hypothetical protein